MTYAPRATGKQITVAGNSSRAFRSQRDDRSLHFYGLQKEEQILPVSLQERLIEKEKY
jgi:hypothetical protein